jgi:hypothetical protein
VGAFIFTSAPLSKSSLTISVWPSCDAAVMAIVPVGIFLIYMNDIIYPPAGKYIELFLKLYALYLLYMGITVALGGKPKVIGTVAIILATIQVLKHVFD